MSADHVTPVRAEQELRRIARKLEERTDALLPLLDGAAEAEVDNKIAYAKALLVARGETVGEREARAVIATEDVLRKSKHSEAIGDACRESVRSLRAQLSAVQSVNANVRYLAGLS